MCTKVFRDAKVIVTTLCSPLKNTRCVSFSESIGRARDKIPIRFEDQQATRIVFRCRGGRATADVDDDDGDKETKDLLVEGGP